MNSQHAEVPNLGASAKWSGGFKLKSQKKGHGFGLTRPAMPLNFQDVGSAVTIRATCFIHDSVVFLEDINHLLGNRASSGDFIPEFQRFGFYLCPFFIGNSR